MILDLDAMLRTADDAACERDSETFAGAYADDVRALVARVRELERMQTKLVIALEVALDRLRAIGGQTEADFEALDSVRWALAAAKATP